MAAFPTGENPDADDVADWVELTALRRQTVFKRGEIRSALEREGATNPDRSAEETWHVLEERSKLHGARWPLVLANSRLSRRANARVSLSLYRFLGLLSLGEDVDGSDRALFEDVVAGLLSPLSGRPGYRTGHPARPGQLRSFRDRVNRYGLFAALADSEIGVDPLPDDKDLGLDAASWWRFGDARGGDLHFVAQCATGGDWEEKLADLNLDVWVPHIAWAVPPVRVFATPRVLLVPSPKWIRLTRKGGLILDRPRLVELSLSTRLSSRLMSEMKARVRSV